MKGSTATYRFFAAIFVAWLASGCADATAVITEPEPARMEIRIGGTLVATVEESGSITGPGVRLVRNVAADLEVTFRDLSGRVVADEGDFRVDVIPASSSIVSFTRTGPRRGTLLGQTFGNTTATFRLVHVSQGHEDFPPSVVPILVQ
jgi:hypothetical protein